MNIKSLVALVAGIFNRLPGWMWVPALLTRLFVGYFFMTSGWGKIHNLATFTANFQSWGIPYPAFNAALSSYTEFLGGLFTILGVGMRFVSIPMIINMIVAVLSVKLKEVMSLSDFVNLDEPLYGLVFVWLFFSGAGWPSIDAIIKVIVSNYLASGNPPRSLSSGSGISRTPTRASAG